MNNRKFKNELKKTTDQDISEALEDKIMDILSLETDLRGQAVLKNWEDVQSNWEFAVKELKDLIKQERVEAIASYKKIDDRLEIEIRIEELNRLLDYASDGFEPLSYAADRIIALTASKLKRIKKVKKG